MTMAKVQAAQVLAISLGLATGSSVQSQQWQMMGMSECSIMQSPTARSKE